VLKGKINTSRVPKLQNKRRLAHQDAAVADEGGRRQTLGEGIGNHLMCVQRDEFDKNSLDQFAHEITADVNVARRTSFLLTATLTRLSLQISVVFCC